MSVLETPRIYFCGQTSFDPVTTNNYPRNYDEMGAQTVITPDGSTQKFRDAAIADVTSNGNWNPHGTYRSRFFDTKVVGVDIGAGTSTNDVFVGAPVNFLGMLVDMEPFGSMSSQLFFDQMNFGIDGGCQIAAARNMRMNARQINFGRNPNYGCIAGVASVVWQSSFPKGASLPLYARGSTAITALAKALEDVDVLGLTVRWNAYRTVYYDNVDCRNGNAVMKQESLRLQTELKGGGFQPNPARSRVVGVLGLWRKSDAPQVIGDRGLISTGNGPLPPVPHTPTFAIATASARLNQNNLVIDLANSIPETGPDLTKYDYGPIHVMAGTTVVATLQVKDYNQSAYEASAGIVTCALTSAAAALVKASDLSLVDANKTVYLQEASLHVCEITPNTYLNPGDNATLSVQVFNRGAPAPAGVPVYWVNTATSGAISEQSLTDGNGVATLAVTGTQSNLIGQIDSYVASADNPPPDVIDTMRTSYLWVRTLPAGDDVSRLQPTWENVYQNVLYNWHAMAPCMDNWLRLDDPQQVAAYAPIIKKLTDPNNFEWQRFMPVTRDMTQGQRTLLYAWLDLHSGATSKLFAAAANAAPAKERTQAEMSRSFRSG